MSHRGSILALPSGIRAWAGDAPSRADARKPSRRSSHEADAIELLLLGTGLRSSPFARRAAPALPRGRDRARRDADRRRGAHLQRPRRARTARWRGADRGGVTARSAGAGWHGVRPSPALRGARPRGRSRPLLGRPSSRRRDKRPHLFALYAFNFEIARVRDSVREALPGEIRLQWWRDALQGEARGDVRANPVAAALDDTIVRFRLPRQALVDLDRRARLRPLRRPDADPERSRGLLRRDLVDA